jgi:hypothetical protein
MQPHSVASSVATSGLDFNPPGKLEAHFNSTNGVPDCSSVIISIEDDLRLEGVESFFIDLLETDPEEPAVLLSQPTLQVFINDNDSKR